MTLHARWGQVVLPDTGGEPPTLWSGVGMMFIGVGLVLCVCSVYKRKWVEN